MVSTSSIKPPRRQKFRVYLWCYLVFITSEKNLYFKFIQSLSSKCMKVQHALYDQDSFLPPTYKKNSNCFFVGNKKEPWWARLPKEVCDMIEHIDSFYINHIFFSKHNNCSVIIFFFTYFTHISNLTDHQHQLTHQAVYTFYEDKLW